MGSKEEKEKIKEENLEKLKQTKNKNFATSVGHALDGIIRAFKTERNLKIDFIIGLFVLIFSLFFDFTRTEFTCLCLTIGFVIFAEMINSTVEYVVDLVTDKYDDRAKAAKDIAAGGVLISSFVAVVVGYFLFSDKIYNISTNLISSVLDSKLHVLFIITFAIIILAVIFKGMMGKGEDYVKTSPSARVALAYGLMTYLYLYTKNIFVTGIAFILAFLITQIRIESTKSKPIFMILSALLGIMVVLIIYSLVVAKPLIIGFLQNIF